MRPRAESERFWQEQQERIIGLGEHSHRKSYYPLLKQQLGRLKRVNSLLNGEIAQHKETEQLLHSSLAEKEVLLRELYHRTKNNMQVISSILMLQSLEESDKRLQAVLRVID